MVPDCLRQDPYVLRLPHEYAACSERALTGDGPRSPKVLGPLPSGANTQCHAGYATFMLCQLLIRPRRSHAHRGQTDSIVQTTVKTPADSASELKTLHGKVWWITLGVTTASGAVLLQRPVVKGHQLSATLVIEGLRTPMVRNPRNYIAAVSDFLKRDGLRATSTSWSS